MQDMNTAYKNRTIFLKFQESIEITKNYALVYNFTYFLMNSTSKTYNRRLISNK